jgi:spore germination protein GerM
MKVLIDGRRSTATARRCRMLAACVAVLLACACGITTQGAPQPVVRNQLPNTAVPQPPQVSSVVQVYLVRDGRLVPVIRSGRSTDDAIRSLSAGPTTLDAGADLETRVPRRSVALGAGHDEDVVVMDVTSAFTELPDHDRFLAAAQLVWTATEICCATRVRVRLGTRALALPTDTGEVARPVRRDDYRSVAPA